MAARNKVIAGDFKEKFVVDWLNRNSLAIRLDFWGTQRYHINDDTVESFTVTGRNYKGKMAMSLLRATVGGIVAGPIGLLAGAIYKNDDCVCIIDIQFEDGKTSVIEVDNAVYKQLAKTCPGKEKYVAEPDVDQKDEDHESDIPFKGH